jgi:undecaprenyl-diphosphatase
VSADAASRDKGPLGRTPADASAEQSAKWRSILLVLGLVGLFVCLVILGLLAQIVQRQEADALDAFATPFLHAMASPGLDAVMNAATFVGSDVTLVPIAAVIIATLFWQRRRRESLFVAAALGGSLVANLAMKLFFHRPRPILAWAHVLPDYSFPSGHSMNSLAFTLALAIVAWRILGARWGVAAVVAAVVVSLAIGASRIYLGYHYLTDVVGGFMAAILWVAIVVGVFRAEVLWRARRAARALSR